MNQNIFYFRLEENDRANTLLEAVRSYVGSENNFHNLNKEKNFNLKPAPTSTQLTSGMIRTVSTFNLRNGITLENNNNHEKEEEEEKFFESNDTDTSQNSLNSEK